MVLAAAASAAFATVAIDLVNASRTASIEAAHLEHAATVRLAAEGGLSVAAAALADASQGDAPPDDGRWSLRIGDVDVRVAAIETTGLLPLNEIGGDALDAVLVALGAPIAGAPALRDAILDWRDPDDDPRRSGAEAALYRAEERPPPANRGFRHISELALVRTPQAGAVGRDPQADAALRRAKEALAEISTVWSSAPGVNLRAAPEAVLAALPDLPPPLRRRAIRERVRLTETSSPRDRQAAGPSATATSAAATSAAALAELAPPEARQFLTTRRSGVWVMTAVATLPNGAQTKLRRVLRIADPRTPGGPIWWIDHASLISAGLDFRGGADADKQARSP